MIASVIKPNHPAKYTDSFIPVFAKMLKGRKNVYDPMAGTGKIGKIRDYGFKGSIFCGEIEPEWTNAFEGVDQWFIGDSSKTSFLKDCFFDAVCTSPTYGNRMADHFNSKDGSKRVTYRHYLGRELHKNNTGRMQWGSKYKKTHMEIYTECIRVLNPKGIFVLNMSDHIRAGKQVRVTDWHRKTLTDLGLVELYNQKIRTNRMGFGSNSKLRVDCEHLIVFMK